MFDHQLILCFENRFFQLTKSDLPGQLDNRFAVLILLELKGPLHLTDLLTEKWEEWEERKIFCYCEFAYTCM